MGAKNGAKIGHTPNMKLYFNTLKGLAACIFIGRRFKALCGAEREMNVRE